MSEKPYLKKILNNFTVIFSQIRAINKELINVIYWLLYHLIQILAAHENIWKKNIETPPSSVINTLSFYLVHCATNVTHTKVLCEKYKFYMHVSNKIYNGILRSIHAFVTIISWTSAQPIHSNNLSNIGNQKSHLTFWQHETLKTNNSSNVINLLHW